MGTFERIDAIPDTHKLDWFGDAKCARFKMTVKMEDGTDKVVNVLGMVSMSGENWAEIQFLHPVTLETTRVALELPDKDKKWGRV